MTTLSKRPKAPEQAPPKVGAADTLVIEAGSLTVWQGTNTSAGQIGLKNSRQDVIEVTKKSLGGRRRAVSALKRNSPNAKSSSSRVRSMGEQRTSPSTRSLGSSS